MTEFLANLGRSEQTVNDETPMPSPMIHLLFQDGKEVKLIWLVFVDLNILYIVNGFNLVIRIAVQCSCICCHDYYCIFFPENTEYVGNWQHLVQLYQSGTTTMIVRDEINKYCTFLNERPFNVAFRGQFCDAIEKTSW